MISLTTRTRCGKSDRKSRLVLAYNFQIKWQKPNCKLAQLLNKNNIAIILLINLYQFYILVF